MGRYTDNHCAVCFRDLVRPQNTCGAPECLAEWKTWSAPRRFRQKNLAHMPPSERALVLAQGPSDEEREEQTAMRESLEAALEAARQPKRDNATMPASLRTMLAPENMPIKKEDPNAPKELPSAQTKTPPGSDSAESEDPVDFDPSI